MPGRVATRNVESLSAAQKAPSQPLRSRRTTASPNVAIPAEGPASPLRTRICLIFGDAQKSTAAHRKLAVNLRKIQEECCYEQTSRHGLDQGDFGEDDFNVEIARCVIRLMGVKKSEGAGDRIVRFLGMFLRRATDKGQQCSGAGTRSFRKADIPRLQTLRLCQKSMLKILRRSLKPPVHV